MNTKFNNGDRVGVKFNNVEYTGKVVFVLPKGIPSEGYQSYIVNGDVRPHYIAQNDVILHCNFHELIWPETCLTMIIPPPPPIKVGEYDAVISADGATVKVGCQTIPKAQVEAVLEQMNKAAGESVKEPEYPRYYKSECNHCVWVALSSSEGVWVFPGKMEPSCYNEAGIIDGKNRRMTKAEAEKFLGKPIPSMSEMLKINQQD